MKYREFVRNGIGEEMWGGGIYKENLRKAIELNITKSLQADKKYISALTKDIIKSYLEMEITPEEYFVWDFEHKTRKEREEFLPNMTKDKILLNRVPLIQLNRLRDKLCLFNLLPDFFRRDITSVKNIEDRDEYLNFVNRHSKYFVKPLDGQCGHGAKILEGDHFDSLLSSGKWIVEEIIQQDSRLLAFNNSSVNTVRFPSFLKDGKFIPLAPFFRTGRKGSIVDNGGAGGVFAAIDVKTGIIMSDGMDENNNRYPKHPDSQIIFKGYQIPLWNDLLTIAEKAHRKLKDQRYIAWDFALSPKGWVLVEANSMGQFLWQYATGIGVKKQFEELMNS